MAKRASDAENLRQVAEQNVKYQVPALCTQP